MRPPSGRGVGGRRGALAAGLDDATRHRLRNVIERTFCRIKDFGGIATRCDKTASDFFAAICLITAITY